MSIKIDIKKFPVVFILWNRGYRDLDRQPELANGDELNFGHGHDEERSTDDHIFCLDGDFGKEPCNPTDNEYSILAETHTPLPLTQQNSSEKSNIGLTGQSNTSSGSTATTLFAVNAKQRSINVNSNNDDDEETHAQVKIRERNIPGGR